MLRAINHATEDLQRRLQIFQIWFLRSTMPRKIYNEDYWFSKYGFYGQPCHRGFTAKITDMVFTVNHATPWSIYSKDYWLSKYGFTVNHTMEDLQQRLGRFLLSMVLRSTMPQSIYSIEY